MSSWVGVALVCLAVNTGIAQHGSLGPRIAAFAGVRAALAEDPHGLANPASAGHPGRIGLAVTASRSYGLSQLQHVSGSLMIGVGRSTFGTALESFGFDEFRRLSAHAIGTRRMNGAPASAGVRITYTRFVIAGFGSLGNLRLSAGLRWSATTAVALGVVAENIATLRRDSQDAHRRLAAGLRAQVSNDLALFLDVDKESGFVPSVHGALELTVMNRFALRSGFSSAPMTFAFGVSARVGGVEAAVGTRRHQPLGWSRCAGAILARQTR